jgi:recombination protein RecR
VQRTKKEGQACNSLPNGSLSPIRGVHPGDLCLDKLLPRLKPANNEGIEVHEVVLATNPNTKGEAIANYINRLLKPLGRCVTRLAMGMPAGSDLEIRRRCDDGQGAHESSRDVSSIILRKKVDSSLFAD